MKTRLTELLGIEHPIIQGPMSYVSSAPLVGAVSAAGGLGIIGVGGMESVEELRDSIREVRRLTDKPFGVNIIAEIYQPLTHKFLEAAIEERVPVINFAFGVGEETIRQTKQAKGAEQLIICTVGLVRRAPALVQAGADVLIVEGMEAGGHTSYQATIVLVPLVVDKVSVPVAAAGGIADGRGLAAALALGAEGVCMGTRFIVTQESPVHENAKQAIIQASDTDTRICEYVDGVRCRYLKNKLIETKLAERRMAPLEEMWKPGVQRHKQGWIDGDTEWGALPCGEICGMVNDLPACRELIERIVAEAEETIRKMNGKLSPLPLS